VCYEKFLIFQQLFDIEKSNCNRARLHRPQKKLFLVLSQFKAYFLLKSYFLKLSVHKRSEEFQKASQY